MKQSRKDDLESLIYLVIYIIHNQNLPWLDNINDIPLVYDVSKHIINLRLKNFNKYQEIIEH